ncbi:ANTAR domain-containing protein [Cellulomonas cellasea]|uniref:AmiR/NasT family two-component response regulator n=1 Tax=Cellulomonas cellasea TaxID=43670 RepID=A0A7W4YD74_9CELL|nr:ANTAR domain-containing protein [Cellulomonas cellasea]MBB2925508.1 AmiR/NasT family two-component response regulator [Cellulomonas cellasea]
MGRLARAQAFTDELTQATRVYLRWASGSPSAPDLRTALSEYTVLNQATGIVMARQRCSHEDALQVLRDTAARSGAPLHDAADTVVQEVTGATATPPAPFIPRRPPRTPAQHT